MRRVGPRRPPEPKPSLPLYLVRWCDVTGETTSSLHRTLPAALRKTDLVTRRGGSPTVHHLTADWRPLDREA